MVYVVLGIVLFMLSTIPTKKNKKMEWMKGYSFHRGKYYKDQSIPENSLQAIQSSVDEHVDIEFDVRITQDNHLIVFHDETLQRMCGVDMHVEDMTYDAICELLLKNTDQKIPTFEEALEIVNGKVNLIIEIKPTEKINTVCNLVMSELENYQGQFAICSFHPMIVTYFKKYYPTVIRGQIIKNFLNDKKQNVINRLLLSINGYNFYTRSDFISVQYQMVGLFIWMRLFKGFICTWAIQDRKWLNKLEKKVDHVIIEFIDYEK